MSPRPSAPLVLSWEGRPPSLELERQLASASLTIARGRTPEAALVVVASEAPRAPADHPWVWLAPSTPAAKTIAAATLAGARDVIDGSSAAGLIARRLLARAREQQLPVDAPPAAPHLIADSAAGKRLLRELHHAARTSMAVLLTGETGTGKEVAARLLHQWSARRARRFVPINCAAIPNDMLEAELFGYAKGAFSGAVQGYEGQLVGGEGGTVFLDEVDDTPLSFQVKMLRVLEDKVVSRLGETQSKRVDFRIIAGSNRDLRDLIGRGQFGADLYERLAIVSIRLPPLRERLDDLPSLCLHLCARFYAEEPSARDRHQVREVTAEAMSVLRAYAWPGNIRELRNVVFGALVRKRAGEELLVSDLPQRLLGRSEAPLGSNAPVGFVDATALSGAVVAGRFNLRVAVADLERQALTHALQATGGNAARAAALLGEVGRGTARDPGATVRAMMKRLGVAKV